MVAPRISIRAPDRACPSSSPGLSLRSHVPRTISSGWIAAPVSKVAQYVPDCVIRAMYRGADRSIFPDSLDTIRWLPKGSTKAVFIPIGANIPEPLAGATSSSETRGSTRTVAIFCLTGAPHFHRELQEIAEAMRSVVASGAKIRLLFFGRGTDDAREDIGHAFCDMPIEVADHGASSYDGNHRNSS